MSCIKEYKLTQFLDGGCLEEEAGMIESHLSGCGACRNRLQRLLQQKGFVARKAELLDPVVYPAEDVGMPDRTIKISGGVSTLEPGFWLLRRALRPVAAALALVVLVAGGLFFGPKLFPPKHPAQPELTGAASSAGQYDIVRYVRVDGRPAQTYIIKEPQTNTTIVWVESK